VQQGVFSSRGTRRRAAAGGWQAATRGAEPPQAANQAAASGAEPPQAAIQRTRAARAAVPSNVQRRRLTIQRAAKG